MRLFIAEKPSLGRAIADVLPKPHRKGDGFIECGNGQVVTWCIGHLLEQAQPDVYDSRYARWNLTDLPIVPEKWQLQPKPSVTKQLNVIKRLLGEAEEVIHAGDPDREGQLLVDEVLDYLQLAPEKRQQVQRCLINDLNPVSYTHLDVYKRQISTRRRLSGRSTACALTASLCRFACRRWRGRAPTGCTASI